MNFLLESDNLTAFQLLEKTHQGRIDLIHIDPLYNTGNKDFVYDDTLVDKTIIKDIVVIPLLQPIDNRCGATV